MSGDDNFQAGPDPEQTTQEATDWFNILTGFGSNVGVPGFVNLGMAAHGAAELIKTPSKVLKIIATVVGAIAECVAAFLNAIDQVKEQSGDQFNDLLAANVNELLGTSLSGGDLTSGSGQAAGMERNQQIGDTVLGSFEDAFGGGGAVTPAQGADNARKFCGWAVSFATSQGFLSILTEASSLGFLKEFHELPEALQQSLGLGRLQRLALQPLIQMAIQKPYERYCNDKYRPTQLAEAQLVRALHSGDMNEGDVRQALAELGYSDDNIDFILSDFAVKLALSEQLTLLNNGDMQEQDVINNLTMTGMPEDQAKLQLKAAQEAEATGQQRALMSAVGDAYINGRIDQETYNSVLSSLPLSDSEIEAFRATVGFKQETPRKTLSFSDVEAAIVDGVVDFGYLDKWFAQEGYDTDAQSILSFKVLKAITKTTEKQAYAKYRAEVFRKAGKPVPPWITDAETAT